MTRSAPTAARTPRWRRTIVPVAASIALHTALLAIAVVATVAVIRPADTDPGDALSPPVTVDLAPAPTRPNKTSPDREGGVNVAPTQTTPAPSETDAARRAINTARAAQTPAAPTPPRSDTTDSRATPPAPDPLPPPPRTPDQTTPAPPPPITFAGVTERPATHIAFAVDASGAMASSWPIVADELAGTIDRLRPTQSVQIFLFGPTDNQGRPRSPPIETDTRGYFPATRDNARAVRTWLESVIPSGRSQPLVGLEHALALEPQTLFLLSRSIRRTGVDAAWGVGRERTLERLEQLNPLDDATGRRPTSIAAVQFIEPDPSGLMDAIAAAHGGRSGAARVVTLEQLGLPPREAPEPTLDERDAEALRAAGEALNAPGVAAAADHAVLGLPTPAELRTIRDAADRALTALQRASPPSDTADPRLAQLRGRAAALLAAAITESTPDTTTNTSDDTRRAILEDLTATARTNLEPLEPIEPEAAAERTFSLALAESIAGVRDSAIARTDDLLRNASALELDPATIARARLLRLRLDPDAQHPDQPNPDANTHTNNYFRLLSAEARARDALRTAPGDPAAFAPLLNLLSDDGLAAAARKRLRTTAARAPALARTHPDHRVALALVDHLETDHPGAAAGVLIDLADRAPDRTGPQIASTALARAARLLEPVNPDRAIALLLRLAADHGDENAARRALDLVDNPARPDLLATLLDALPSHPDADAWRLERAATRTGRARLALLDEIEPTSPVRRAADELTYATVRALLDDDPTAHADLKPEAVRLAARLGRPEAAELALRQAEATIGTNPDEARRMLADLRATHPDRDRVTLALARADLAIGDTTSAHAALVPMVDRLTDPPPAAARGGPRLAEAMELRPRHPGPRDAVRAHAVRLRWHDPSLGGPATRRRIEAIPGVGPTTSGGEGGSD